MPDTECYNGAVRKNYSWSQSIADVDVRIPVPECVRRGEDVQVSIQAQSLDVHVKHDINFDDVVCGKLCWKINKEESMWTLLPGECIQINLAKSDERWWDALLEGEEKIDLSEIDACREKDTLSAEEQATVDKMLYDHHQKLRGKPTTEEQKLHNIMKEAWDKEGSPFRGQPFDPSKLKFNLGGSLNLDTH